MTEPGTEPRTEPGFTESVYLDAVSADGRTGFVTRLARHPDDGVAWLWLHVFLPDAIFGFNRDDLPLGGGVTVGTATSDAATTYALNTATATARFERTGEPSRPLRGPLGPSGPLKGPLGPGNLSGANVRVQVLAHKGGSVPASDGPLALDLTATFSPTGAAGSNLPGRTEVLGDVTARVTTPDAEYIIEGRGQFHEQHQTAPRFTVPFTYGTLRGGSLGLVFLIGPRASTAFVRANEGEGVVARQVRISAVDAHRSLDLEFEQAPPMRLELTWTHHYLVPIVGRPRESSIVVASYGEEILSGCVNDWKPHQG